jgi:hypothetical protein
MIEKKNKEVSNKMEMRKGMKVFVKLNRRHPLKKRLKKQLPQNL